MTDQRSRPNVPPGPFVLTALKHYASGSFADTPRFLLSCAQRYGPIWSFRVFNKRIFVIDDAEAIRSVLIERQHLFQRSRGMELLRQVMGDGLMTSEDPLHVRQRRLMQPAFHRSRIGDYAEAIVAEVLRTIGSWHEGAAIDLLPEMMRMTLTIVGAALFGTNVTSETHNVREAVEELVAIFPEQVALWAPLTNRLVPSRARRIDSITGRLDESLNRIIDRRRQSADGADLLGMLLSAQDDDGSTMTTQQARDEAMTILAAGHETTAIGITWALALVAFHAPVRRRLEAEIEAVVGNATPRFEQVAALRYTAAVFEEALRLYSPIWGISRRAMSDTELLGYQVPEGSNVVMSPYVTHRNPRYFDDPLEFNPDRWLGGDRPPKLAFFPFGAGARGCIGEGLARLEGVLALATIVRRVRLTPTEATLPDVAAQLTLRPTRSMIMTAAPRTSAERQDIGKCIGRVSDIQIHSADA